MSKRTVFIDNTPLYQPADPAPDGYLEWHAWAEVQHKAGLRQKRCPGCSRWYYPQEVANHGACGGRGAEPSTMPTEATTARRRGRTDESTED